LSCIFFSWQAPFAKVCVFIVFVVRPDGLTLNSATGEEKESFKKTKFLFCGIYGGLDRQSLRRSDISMPYGLTQVLDLKCFTNFVWLAK